jgi:hypothetical protein
MVSATMIRFQRNFAGIWNCIYDDRRDLYVSRVCPSRAVFNRPPERYGLEIDIVSRHKSDRLT